MSCVRIHSDDSQIIHQDGIVKTIYFDPEDPIDERSVFIILENFEFGECTSRIIHTTQHVDVTHMINLDDYTIEYITSMPLSLYISSNLNQEMNITIDETKDHPICLAVKSKHPDKFFRRIIDKIKRADPKFKYVKCTNTDIYHRFKILMSVKELINLAFVGFDHNWLINETDFLLHLYNCYRNSGSIGKYLSNSSWIACGKIQTVLQLLMTYPAPDFGLFFEKCKASNLIELSADNVNSIFCIIDTYNLDDSKISDIICYCIQMGIRFDVVTINELWNIPRMNSKFYSNNFASVIGAMYSSGNNVYRNCVEKIYFELCDRHQFSNSNLQSLVKKTIKDKHLLCFDPHFNAKHVLEFYNSDKDIQKHVLPLYKTLKINERFLLFINQVRANKALIFFFVHIIAVRRGKGKYHSVLSNTDLIPLIFSYVGVSEYYIKYFIEDIAKLKL